MQMVTCCGACRLPDGAAGHGMPTAANGTLIPSSSRCECQLLAHRFRSLRKPLKSLFRSPDHIPQTDEYSQVYRERRQQGLHHRRVLRGGHRAGEGDAEHVLSAEPVLQPEPVGCAEVEVVGFLLLRDALSAELRCALSVVSGVFPECFLRKKRASPILFRVGFQHLYDVMQICNRTRFLV